jgi:hypothetical protein
MCSTHHHVEKWITSLLFDGKITSLEFYVHVINIRSALLLPSYVNCSHRKNSTPRITQLFYSHSLVYSFVSGYKRQDVLSYSSILTPRFDQDPVQKKLTKMWCKCAETRYGTAQHHSPQQSTQRRVRALQFFSPTSPSEWERDRFK